MDLEAFARAELRADQYANDEHLFRLFECVTCGAVPLTLTIEHDTGSEPHDFKGLIRARCSRCNGERVVFGFTGGGRKPWREEKPACECGGGEFLAGMCERYEGADGLTGFFDEGIIVGKCARCLRNRVFAATD